MRSGVFLVRCDLFVFYLENKLEILSIKSTSLPLSSVTSSLKTSLKFSESYTSGSHNFTFITISCCAISIVKSTSIIFSRIIVFLWGLKEKAVISYTLLDGHILNIKRFFFT